MCQLTVLTKSWNLLIMTSFVCLEYPQGNHNYLAANDSQGKSQFPFPWSLRAAKEIAFCLDVLEGLNPRKSQLPWWLMVVMENHNNFLGF